MRAARYYGPGDIRVQDVEEPSVGEGQVKIKVAWNALSSLDAQLYFAPKTTTLPPLVPTATKPNKLTGEKLPITLGHQFSGTIAELGSSVDAAKWGVGQRVSVNPLLSCLRTESCQPCADGRFNVCSKATLIGLGGKGGGLADYVVVNVRNVHHLPQNVSLEVGAMIEPLAVAVNAVKRSGYEPGQVALISGSGPIGLLILKVLRSIDPTAYIITSEPIKNRRELASKQSETVDPHSSDGILLAKVYGETLGAGVDVAFEAAGTQESLDAALMCVKAHGTLVNVAIWSNERNPHVNMNLVNAKELRLTGVMGGGDCYSEGLELVHSGRVVNIEETFMKTIGLEDAVEKGIGDILARDSNHVQVLVSPFKAM